jgi:hypothetical protein
MAINKETCSKSCCPCGWLSKRVLGLSIAAWLILFAILPMSARGVSWSARTVAGLWDGGVKVVGVDRPDRGERAVRRDRSSE